MSQSRKRFVTDASHSDALGMAGIAICWKGGGEPVCSDVVSSVNANVAEALAVLRALKLSKEAGYKRVEVHTDCALIPRTIASMSNSEEGRPGGDQFFIAVCRDIRAMMKNRAWKVSHIERAAVRPAHIMSRQTLKAWKAGREDGKSTWSRGSK